MLVFDKKLDSISKSILRRQNPLEFIFEDISTFDSENPVVGFLLRELDIGKKIASDLIRQAPGPPGIDFACRNRLNKLRDRQEWTDNNNISPPPSPPTLPPGPGQAPLVSTTLKDYLEIYLVHKHKYQKEKKKKFRKELGNTSYESPDPPKLELGDGLLNSLGVEADDILEQKFVNQKQQEDAVLEKIKEEYNFDEIKDAFDEAAVRHQLDFFYGGENSNFNQVIKFLLSSNKNENLLHFYYLIRDKI